MKLWYERGAWISKRSRSLIEGMNPANVSRIAVIRHAALGDMVLVRPFLAELRCFFPNAKLVLSLVSNYIYGAPVDLVDEVHVIPGSDKRELSFSQQFVEYRGLGSVDILFDFADTARSRYLTFLTQATIKVGFPYRGYLRPLLFDAAVWRSDFVFEAVTMLHALMLFGGNPKLPADFSWPKSVTAAQPDRPRVIYFPFASVSDKCWPKARFVQLIREATQCFPNIDHVLLGGISETECVAQFADALTGYDNVVLQPSLPLEELLGFLSQASIVVSNDTGVRNLAIALDRPTLGIFFTTVPYRYWPRYDPKHQAIFNTDGCPPLVSTVFDELERMLKKINLI